MGVDKKDTLQALGSQIEYVSSQLSENDQNFTNCINAMNQAAANFNVPELAGLANNLQQLRVMNQQTSMGIEGMAQRVRQLSES